MLIRSQGKETLVNFDNLVTIEITEEFNTVTAIEGCVTGGRVLLGEYSNHKKAAKVLDIIQEEYTNYNTMRMGMMGYARVLIPRGEIDVLDEKEKFLVEHAVFQMPQDDEVEI